MITEQIKYKQTGIEWMPQVPEHWNVLRLKSVLHSGTNGVWGDVPQENSNDIICVRVADIDEWVYGISEENLTLRNIEEADQEGRLLNYGDLIIEKSGGGDISPVGRVVIYNLNIKAVTSNFMATLNVVSEINREFLYYYFKFLYRGRLNVPSIKATTGIQNLDLYSYLQNPIPVPLREEQDEIVLYIKFQSKKINYFIQKKQRFIELLKEQRQSIINQAVTKGIDENVKMKPSDVEWLGDLPEHWEVRRLKFLGNIKSGDSIVSENLIDNGEYEVYGGNGFMGFTNQFNIEGENIVIGRVGAKCGNVRYVNQPKWISDNALIVKLNENENYEFISIALEAMDLNSLNSSSAQPLITGTKVMNVYLPYPIKEEQKQIVQHIKTETQTIDKAIAKAEKEIELIKEYKESMIAEAVTGKLNRI